MQSVFYALFAAWILWDKKADVDAVFDVDDAHSFLPIPFLDALLHDIRHPARMKHLGLEPHLARAISASAKPAAPRTTITIFSGPPSCAAFAACRVAGFILPVM